MLGGDLQMVRAGGVRANSGAVDGAMAHRLASAGVKQRMSGTSGL
jgi:hypothetical protein